MVESLRPNDRDLLRAAVRQIARRSGIGIVYAGLVARDALTITEFVGTDYFGARDTEWREITVHAGEGVGGSVVERAGPLVVPDYLAATGISHQHDHLVRLEGLQSMVAVPILVHGRPRGVLYASTRERVRLGERAVDLLDRAGQAIGHEFGVRDEVDRRLWLMRTAPSAPPAHPRLVDGVREAHADLLALAGELTDPDLVHRVLSVADRLRPAPPAGGPPAPTRPRLSRREIEVLAQVAMGCTYAETGERLALQAVTVKSYMRSVLTKLSAGNRVEAIAIARRHGLIP